MFRRYDDDESPTALGHFLVSALVLHIFIFKRGVGGLFWGGGGGGAVLCGPTVLDTCKVSGTLCQSAASAGLGHKVCVDPSANQRLRMKPLSAETHRRFGRNCRPPGAQFEIPVLRKGPAPLGLRNPGVLGTYLDL